MVRRVHVCLVVDGGHDVNHRRSDALVLDMKA
jgi:hypothetical protein